MKTAMKTPLRISLLLAALALTALTAGKAASSTGSCLVVCRNDHGQVVGPYNLSTTYSQCCSGVPRSPSPCPPGYNQSYSEDKFTYSDGRTVSCPA
jgi:hypothetical protein